MKLVVPRFLIGVVLVMNLHCAVVFIFKPVDYMTGFGLDGITGETAVRGMGVLFLMWNVPYLMAFSHPMKRLISLYESIAMQSIGMIGESLLITTISDDLLIIRETVQRYILFDGAGLILL